MALIDKASLLMVPSTYEDGTLYNVLPSGNKAPDETGSHNGYDQTRADFTFSRGSNLAATRVNSDGLIEKGRENLYTQSNNFSHSDWNVKAGTFTQGEADPDGGNNAWAWEATNTDPYLYQSGKSTSGVSVLSIWVKGVGSTIGASFQIRTGAAPYKNLTLTGEWQRVEHYNTNTSGTSVGFEFGNPAVVGDVVHIYQAQYEVGLVATDYIETGSSTAQAGILEDMPRINYDANGENGALLLEPSRTNLFENSEYFGGSDWSKTNIGLTTNDSKSPEGVNNASLIYPAATQSGSPTYIYNTTTGSSSKYTISAYVKANGLNVCWLYISSSATYGIVYFDLSDESIQVVAGSASTPTGTITDMGDGWYRVTATLGAAASIASGSGLGISDAKGNWAVTKNGEDGVLVYGLQIEAGSYVSSYIPTHGAAVTRGAEGKINRIPSPITFAQNEDFTLYFEGEFFAVSPAPMLMGGRTTSNAYWWVQSLSTGKMSSDSANQMAAYTGANLTLNTRQKILVKRDSNTISFYLNGTALTTTQGSGVADAWTFQSLGYGFNDVGSYAFNGRLYEAIVFNEALTDAECVTLTTL